MKKFISISIVLITLTFVSCRKETTPGPLVNSTPPVSINVEYRAYSESGHINLQYSLPATSGSTTTQMQVDRTTYSYAFTWTSGQTLNMKASNVVPTGKEVSVEIYVNGQLFKSGEANAPGASAVANGIYQ